MRCGGLTEPVVNPEVWDTVEDNDVPGTEGLVCEVEEIASDCDSEVRVQDQVGILALVEWGARIKVVDASEPSVALSLSTALRLTLVVVVASDVGDEVHWPSKQLLEEEVEEGREWGLLDEFAKGGSHGFKLLGTGLWDEDHVALHVAGGLVMLGVGNLPRVVWDKESRVHPPSHEIVDGLGRRKGTVAALVGENPETSSDQSLNKSVGGVSDKSQFLGWDERNVGVCNVKEGEDIKDIASNVAHGLEVRSLEAVWWNGIADLLDCEIWNLELLAVGVEELSTDWLRLGIRH